MPRLIVFNKIDASDREPSVERDPYGRITAVSVSAKTGLGLDLLRDAIVELAQQTREAPPPESIPAWSPAAVV